MTIDPQAEYNRFRSEAAKYFDLSKLTPLTWERAENLPKGTRLICLRNAGDGFGPNERVEVGKEYVFDSVYDGHWIRVDGVDNGFGNKVFALAPVEPRPITDFKPGDRVKSAGGEIWGHVGGVICADLTALRIKDVNGSAGELSESATATLLWLPDTRPQVGDKLPDGWTIKSIDGESATVEKVIALADLPSEGA